MLRTRAQSLVEYVLLIIGVIALVIAAVAILGTVLGGFLNSSASNIA